jgi:hypothetical protein
MIALPDAAVAQIIAAGVGLAGVAGTTWAGIRWQQARASSDDRVALTRESATALRDALEPLKSVLAGAAHGTIMPTQVAGHIQHWIAVVERHSHRLPVGAEHLERSVRAALGEALGGVVAAPHAPDMSDYPLAEHDPEWHESAESYLSYCLNWLARWHDNPSTRARLLNFDPWLKERDDRYRRAMDGTDTILGVFLHKTLGRGNSA